MWYLIACVGQIWMLSWLVIFCVQLQRTMEHQILHRPLLCMNILRIIKAIQNFVTGEMVLISPRVSTGFDTLIKSRDGTIPFIQDRQVNFAQMPEKSYIGTLYFYTCRMPFHYTTTQKWTSLLGLNILSEPRSLQNSSWGQWDASSLQWRLLYYKNT